MNKIMVYNRLKHLSNRYKKKCQVFLSTAVFVIVTLIMGCENKTMERAYKPEILDFVEAPTNIAQSNIDHTQGEATISWKPSQNTGVLENGTKAVITGYVVEYSTDYFITKYSIPVDEAGINQVILKKLDLNKKYHVRVYAQNNGGEKSDTSDTIAFMVGGASPPGTPYRYAADVKKTIISLILANRYAGLNNDGTPAKIIKYRGVAKADGKDNVLGSFKDGELSFEGLEPGTDYTFEVYAVNDSDDKNKRESGALILNYTAKELIYRKYINDTDHDKTKSTIKCEDAKPGDRLKFEGVTYMVIDDLELRGIQGADFVRSRVPFLSLPTGLYDKALSKVCTSHVTDMRFLFLGKTSFNEYIGDWDTSSVTDMRYMFTGATAFNQDISNWDASSVTDMKAMFYKAATFNQDISNWDISKVTKKDRMFDGATSMEENNKPKFSSR